MKKINIAIMILTLIVTSSITMSFAATKYATGGYFNVTDEEHPNDSNWNGIFYFGNDGMYDKAKTDEYREKKGNSSAGSDTLNTSSAMSQAIQNGDISYNENTGKIEDKSGNEVNPNFNNLQTIKCSYTTTVDINENSNATWKNVDNTWYLVANTGNGVRKYVDGWVYFKNENEYHCFDKEGKWQGVYNSSLAGDESSKRIGWIKVGKNDDIGWKFFVNGAFLKNKKNVTINEGKYEFNNDGFVIE